MSIDKNKVKAYLVKLFTKVINEDTVTNKRAQAFATIANYESSTTGQKVSEVLDADDIGEICNSIRDFHVNTRIKAVASRMATEDTGGF